MLLLFLMLLLLLQYMLLLMVLLLLLLLYLLSKLQLHQIFLPVHNLYDPIAIHLRIFIRCI